MVMVVILRWRQILLMDFRHLLSLQRGTVSIEELALHKYYRKFYTNGEEFLPMIYYWKVVMPERAGEFASPTTISLCLMFLTVGGV